LVSKFGDKNLLVVRASLHSIASIFKRYESVMKSNEVLEELVYILKIIQEPLLRLYQQVNTAIANNMLQMSQDDLRNSFIIVRYLIKIFYLLSCVDLPEYFEDHMADWCNGFHQYLSFVAPPQIAPLLQSDTSAGLLLKLQAQVCQSLNIYIEKYEDEFSGFLPTFMQDVWTLLTKTDDSQTNDQLVTSAIKFLTTTACSTQHSLFAKEEVIRSLCMNIVRPNIMLRDSDEELFEDDPREYIKMDMEGSDTNTRRRAALELVKGLRRNFEREVTALFEADVSTLLQEYTANPKNNWKSKDVAIYLIAALAVKGGTSTRGLTKTNELVPIIDFYRAHILPDISNTNANPIIRSDCVKFIHMFRAQLILNAEENRQLFTTLATALNDPNVVVQTYAAASIERLLVIRDNNQPRFSKEFLQPLAGFILSNLYKLLQQTSETARENEYFMQAIMRVLAVLKELAIPLANDAFNFLLQTLQKVCDNIRNPLFNHYLWEAIAVLIRNVLAAQPALVSNVETMFFPIVQTILTKDITEFTPYALQVLSMLIELSPQMNQSCFTLLPSLLTGLLWQRSGNIPALVRLLSAFIKKAPKEIVAGNHFEPILGVFQALLPSGSTDTEAFNLLEAVILYIDQNVFLKYMPQVFTLIFQRLTTCKTYKINRSFVCFLSLFIAKYGAQTVSSVIEQIQPGLSLQVFDVLFVGNTQKMKTKLERKMCTIAATKLSCELPSLLVPPSTQLFVKLVMACHRLITDPFSEIQLEGQEDTMGVHEITSGSSTSFHRLAFATKQEVDYFPEIENHKTYFTKCLAETTKKGPHAAAAASALQTGATPQALDDFAKWFSECGV